MLREADEVDIVVVAGDLLDISSPVELDSQIVVLLEYLGRLAGRAVTIVCSGNHDLDHRTDDGEKAASWLQEARARGAVVDGESTVVGDWLITSCAWWEGPHTLAALETRLEAAARRRTGPWMWAYHGPPDGPLSWTGSKHYGDPELPRLLDAYRPDLVLCGHIHQAPYVDGGAWAQRRGPTWLFNSGWQMGPVPAHVRLDLDERSATWWSAEGEERVEFGSPAALAQ